MKLENLSNFYLVNKPRNWTSQDLCTVFKKKYSFSKVGHSGTLEPNASGLMLLATNKYTKLFDYLKDTNKTYEFEALFGVESDSFDTDTDVREVESINLKLLQQELDDGIASLTGKIKQTPPIGVIAPSILTSVIANAYKLNENNIIPTKNKYPEKSKLISIKFLAKIPFMINAIE